MRLTLLFCLAVMLLAPADAARAGSGNVAAGEKLARQWCAACHVVAEAQDRAATIGVPSFFDIAANPDMSEAKIATFLADPHPQMPDMGLSNLEIRDLVAYIGSLRR